MFSKNELANIMFLDIETASQHQKFSELNPRIQELWEKKTDILNRRAESQTTAAEMYSDRAAIFAEFGKVVCISCGLIQFEKDVPHFRVKSFFGDNEVEILKEFAADVNKFTSSTGRNLCAHNGKEFDFPYMGRRYIINRLPMPKVLSELQTKKPWEVRLLDTMALWKFGDFKSFTSLDLLTAVLDIPTPKDDIDGSQVGRVFWEEKNYKRISEYCEKDVLATAQVMLSFSGLPLISPENFHSV